MSNVKANSSVDWVSDAITVTPGQSYTFGGWVKGDSDREADISIFPKDASGNWLAEHILTFPTITLPGLIENTHLFPPQMPKLP